MFSPFETSVELVEGDKLLVLAAREVLLSTRCPVGVIVAPDGCPVGSSAPSNATVVGAVLCCISQLSMMELMHSSSVETRVNAVAAEDAVDVVAAEDALDGVFVVEVARVLLLELKSPVETALLDVLVDLVSVIFKPVICARISAIIASCWQSKTTMLSSLGFNTPLIRSGTSRGGPSTKAILLVLISPQNQTKI